MKRFCSLPILFLLALSCVSTQIAPEARHRESPDDVVVSTVEQEKGGSFEVTFFHHRFKSEVTGMEKGDFYTPALSYPPIPVDGKYRHALTFQMSQFFPARREVLPGNGPLILFSDDKDAIVFSPVNHFFVSLIDLKDGAIRYGIEGEVRDVPAGFSHSFILVKGRGIHDAIAKWGDRMRAYAGKKQVDRYADRGLSHLGYWTDAGAAYYWNTLPGKNPEQTLLSVKDEADALGIPYGYFQIDSWWYYTKRPGLVVVGAKRWEPRPEVFPDGLPAFRRKLGLPLIAHTRFFGPDNDHAKRFPFHIEKKVAIPKGREFFDHVMANARAWGIETYEQDWLMNQFWWMDHMRNGVDHTEVWLNNMDASAAKHGLTLQYCMAGAAHLMHTLYLKTPTTIRTSIDHKPSLSKEAYWPQFHTGNMLADAVGIRPFKDTFHTAERGGEAELLMSLLSTGMVGPGDFIGQANGEWLNRACRKDGLLLKPDRPAFPIDAMFYDHQRPYITFTESRREGLGRWVYVAAYHLASEHPERTLKDRLWARFSYDLHDMNRFFVFPKKVTDWGLDPKTEIGFQGPGIAYNWRTGKVELMEDSFSLPKIRNLYDFDYLVFCPLFDNGMALIGEAGKYVTLSDKRFETIETTANGFHMQIAGVPGERVLLCAYELKSARFLQQEVVVPESGTSQVALVR